MPTEEKSLMGVFDLLKNTLATYKNNFWILSGIMLVPVALNFVLVIAQAGTPQSLGNFDYYNIAKFVLGLLVAIISMVISAWTYLTIMFVIYYVETRRPPERLCRAGALSLLKDADKIINIFQKSIFKLPSYIYVNILVVIATLPGVILFGIPAIIYMVWFAFASFVMIKENHFGANALMRSREYVIHRFRQVAGRILFIILLLLAIQFIGFLSGRIILILCSDVFIGTIMSDWCLVPTGIIQAVVNNIIMVITVPLSITYAYTLYLDLKRTRPKLAKQPINTKYKWLYILSPTTILIFILSLFGVVVSLFAKI